MVLIASIWFLLPHPAQAASPRNILTHIDRYVKSGVRKEALVAAVKAYEARKDKVKRPRFLTLIDYAIHSSKPRMFIIDLVSGEMKSLLVAHGRGSDPDHDGYADKFSNVPNSKMSSLGSYITANTYRGKHGLSLRLVGLDKSNSAALQRAIVMHGARYVSPKRGVGRSWGCPSIEKRFVKDIIPKLAGGAFIYATR